MPLVLDPARHAGDRLVEMERSFREDLTGTLELVRQPRGRVLDPMSLRTAEELLTTTLALSEALAADGSDPARTAGLINVQYAVLLAAIDLVKSHTDVPRVPAARR